MSFSLLELLTIKLIRLVLVITLPSSGPVPLSIKAKLFLDPLELAMIFNKQSYSTVDHLGDFCLIYPSQQDFLYT